MNADYTDTLGRVWTRDTYFTLGGQVSAPGVTGTPDSQLYRIARSSFYTDFAYTIPVDNGQYTVTLKFAETSYSAPGQRIFNVVLNGQTVLPNFDILAEVPQRTALDKSFDVTVTDGVIQIDFLRVNRFGIVSAIEILPSGPPPPDVTPPARGAGSPTGSLPAGTTQANLALTTNENATCRYATVADEDFATMPNTFATTGALQHSTPVAGLQDGQAYSFYARCQDASLNANTTDFVIAFDVAAPPPPAISMTSPVGGSTVSGTTAIEVSAQGPSIAGVTFFVDAVQLGAEDVSAPFSVSWDTTLATDAQHALTARLRYGAPEATLDSAAVNVTVDNSTPPPSASAIRIDAGSDVEYTDSLGQLWMPDSYFTEGFATSTASVSGTPDSELYRIARTSLYSNFGYQIPVDNGPQSVTLRFAEVKYTAVGHRTFSVKINGVTVLSNFDILTEVPAKYALDKTFEVNVTNGFVDIEFLQGSKHGVISGLEIVSAGPDVTPPTRSGGSPSGALPYGTTSTLISLMTNENATCRYAASSGTSYDTMADTFTTTGGKQHETTISGLADGQAYTRYVRCSDGAGNPNADDYSIQFSVQAPPPPSISISSPSNGANLSGNVLLQAAAGGPNLLGVTFFVDGLQLGAEDTSAPFQQTWDTTSATDTTHMLSAQLRYGASQALDSSMVSVTVDNTAPPGASEIRINTGRGVNYTDANGKVWMPDQYFFGGTYKYTSYEIHGTNEQDLYRYVRDGGNNGEIWYEIPVDNGLYVVTLKFAEIVFIGPGNRIVDVVINGQRVLRNLDLSEFVGPETAFDMTVKTEVTDGVMRIFLAQVITGRRPTISGIAIEPAGGTERTDLTAPVRSLSGPNGPLPLNTTQTTLQLNTNENAVCRYSTTDDNPFSSMLGELDTTGGTVHSTSITGLIAGMTYIYRVRCRDQALNDNLDDLRMIFSVPASGSSPAPAVSSPGGGAVVSGVVTVQAQVAGDAPDSVQFYANGIPLGPRLTQAPYEFDWQTLAHFNGPYRLTAWARYGGANTAVSPPVDVTLANAGLAAPGTSTVRLHCGSISKDSPDPGSGIVWGHDMYYSGGAGYSVSRVYRTPLPHLYRVARYSVNTSFNYNVPLANGRYKVRLLFSELVHTNPGTRLFDVTLNGVKALEKFDILEEAPWKEPTEKSFQATVTNGNLEIRFDQVLRGAIVSAIEITPAP